MRTQKTGKDRNKAPRGAESPTGASSLQQDKAGKKPASEIELKFEVPELAREALTEALESLHCQIQQLNAHYYDTADGQLAAAGISLRLRLTDQQWVQTLKISGNGGIYDRLEHEVAVPGPVDGTPPPLDIARHSKTPAGKSLKQALKTAGAPKLMERYATEVVRRSHEMVVGNTRVELAFDQGRVTAEGQEAPVCELEFELTAGNQAILARLTRKWVAEYGLWLSTESKSARGERLTGANKGMPVVKASAPSFADNLSEEAILRAMARSCLNQVMPNASAVAAGSRDHDHVHQLRVGLRRLRTVMRELGKLSTEVDPGWEPPLAEVFRQLGTFRDREAVMAALKPRLLKAGVSRTNWMELRSAATDPVATVRDPLFQTALLDVFAFAVDQPANGAVDGSREMRLFLRKRLKALHRQVVDDGVNFKKLSEPAQHKVRKRLKRLRYLSEFATSLFGKEAVDAYLDNLRPAQDALGEHNDYAVANELARQAAAQGDPDADFALGWIQKQQKQSVKNCRQALEKVKNAPRFWKKSMAAP